MAIGRKVLGIKKVVLAFKNDDESLVADPAIDLEKSDLVKYADSMYDLKHISFKENEKPTYFYIQPLTRRQKDVVGDLDGLREKAYWYIRCSLTKISNYQIIDESGNITEITQPNRKENGSLGLMSSEKYCDELDLPDDYLATLFVMIHGISQASIPLAKN